MNNLGGIQENNNLKVKIKFWLRKSRWIKLKSEETNPPKKLMFLILFSKHSIQ